MFGELDDDPGSIQNRILMARFSSAPTFVLRDGDEGLAEAIRSWEYRSAGAERAAVLLTDALKRARRDRDAQLVAELEGQLIRLGPCSAKSALESRAVSDAVEQKPPVEEEDDESGAGGGGGVYDENDLRPPFDFLDDTE